MHPANTFTLVLVRADGQGDTDKEAKTVGGKSSTF